MTAVLLTGFLTCLALIAAVGPQSAFLLRQGLRRDRVMVAVGCCIAGDVLLILAGTAGVGAILHTAPWLLDVIRWAGVAYLTWYALVSFRSALRPKNAVGLAPAGPAESGAERNTVKVSMTSQPEELSSPGSTATQTRPKIQVTSVTTVAATGLSISILNPHAWVDSLVVLGSMANSFADDRWFFALGAIIASVLWLSGLAAGSAALSKVLNKPRTWQIIDACVGVIMLVVAGLLAFSGF